MSRSSRRLSFAAPLILVAACHPKTGPTTRNPPQPEPTRFAEWSVSMSGDACYADDNTPDTCPPDASCNPPPPMTIACPAGMTEESAVIVYQEQEDGPCYLEGEGGAEEVDCPSWE
jgi:hypothetical protein